MIPVAKTRTSPIFLCRATWRCMIAQMGRQNIRASETMLTDEYARINPMRSTHCPPLYVGSQIFLVGIHSKRTAMRMLNIKAALIQINSWVVQYTMPCLFGVKIRMICKRRAALAKKIVGQYRIRIAQLSCFSLSIISRGSAWIWWPLEWYVPALSAQRPWLGHPMHAVQCHTGPGQATRKHKGCRVTIHFENAVRKFKDATTDPS